MPIALSLKDVFLPGWLLETNDLLGGQFLPGGASR
jgi:hypothetical protein